MGYKRDSSLLVNLYVECCGVILDTLCAGSSLPVFVRASYYAYFDGHVFLVSA